jgi:rare lipoprotein A
MRAFLAAALLCAASTAHAEVASCYGAESGTQTASGERFDWHAMTAAHRTLPFGTLVRVTYAGRSVVVRITDRGPFVKKGGRFTRDIDLSAGACGRIGLLAAGVGTVDFEILTAAPYAPKHHDWGF